MIGSIMVKVSKVDYGLDKSRSGKQISSYHKGILYGDNKRKNNESQIVQKDNLAQRTGTVGCADGAL